MRLVLRQGMSLGLTGVVIGSVLAWWAGGFAKPLLFDESPRDPVVFGVVTVALLAVAILASVIPASRATRVDPNSALRAE